VQCVRWLTAPCCAGAVSGLATSSAGSAVHFAGLAPVSRASSYGGSDLAEMTSHHAGPFSQQPVSRHASPPPHAVPESCFSSRGATPMDVDSLPPSSSACSSGSPPASPMAASGQSTADAEVRRPAANTCKPVPYCFCFVSADELHLHKVLGHG
jgi:hypothetical protein